MSQCGNTRTVTLRVVASASGSRFYLEQLFGKLRPAAAGPSTEGRAAAISWSGHE